MNFVARSGDQWGIILGGRGGGLSPQSYRCVLGRMRSLC